MHSSKFTERMTSTLWSPGSVCWEEGPVRPGLCPWGAAPGLSSLPEVMPSGQWPPIPKTKTPVSILYQCNTCTHKT